MLWVFLALLTLATLTALLWPLLRPFSQAPARADCDVAVYRNQLAEVDADVERGILAPDQAGAARLEIQRRMLAAAGIAAPAAANDRRARLTAAIVVALILPVGAGLLYAAYGSPQLPDKPYAERLKTEPAVILAHEADQLAASLVTHPDAAGYVRLAGLFFQQNEFANEAEAYRRAIAHGADNADTWSRMGEAYVLAGGGAVGPKALAAFAKTLSLDARDTRARFYAGLAEAQIGHYRKAVAFWRDLKDDSTNASLVLLLQSEIKKMAKRGGFDAASVPPGRPSAKGLDAAVTAMTKAMNRAPKP